MRHCELEQPTDFADASVDMLPREARSHPAIPHRSQGKRAEVGGERMAVFLFQRAEGERDALQLAGWRKVVALCEPHVADKQFRHREPVRGPHDLRAASGQPFADHAIVFALALR